MMYPDLNFPDLYLRAFIFFIGAAVAVHNFCTANFIHYSPRMIRYHIFRYALLPAAVGSGVGMMFCSALGYTETAYRFSVAAAGTMIAIQLFLWLFGMKVSIVLAGQPVVVDVEKIIYKQDAAKSFREALLGSVGIMVVGFITIPFAGSIAGANITLEQASKMSAVFFMGRLMWLWLLRHNYDRVENLVRSRFCAMLNE